MKTLEGSNKAGLAFVRSTSATSNSLALFKIVDERPGKKLARTR
jgi:hypothetical protein